MDNHIVIEKTKEFVREKLEGEGSGHDWWHIVRVYNNALDIAEGEGNVDCFVVQLASLLHDIADHKFGYSDKDRKNIICNFLEKLDVNSEVVEDVVYIVNNISFKGGTNKHKMITIEGQIVQDADRLDAIGAIGIGRTFAYGGFKKRTMYNPESDKGEDTISHFYEKLLLLKDSMNTKTGKEKASERHKVMEEFLQNFYKEWKGEK